MAKSPSPWLPAKGWCQCGCGRRTWIADQNDSKRGRIKGEPLRFVAGHHARLGIGGSRRGPRRDLAERFWEKVDKTTTPDGCWPWTAHRLPSGYGSFMLNGRPQPAHRVAWLLVNGSLGPDHDWLFPFFQILHACDNPPCCNPAHLKLGTLWINSEDMVAKGRQARGERQARARLTEAEVRKIYRMHQAGTTDKVIAERMGLDLSIVWHVVHGLTWRHITKQEPYPRNGNAKKLTEPTVREARALYKPGVRNYSWLAARYGVRVSSIHRAVTGRSWKHLTGGPA